MRTGPPRRPRPLVNEQPVHNRDHPCPRGRTHGVLLRGADPDAALRCYGRVWEKAAAGFRTPFILGTLMGTGTAIGLAIVWLYHRYA